MKQPGEELQETLTELDDRAVVDYLIKNPEFFIRNARAVEAIRVPHPVRGTVSLVEWHMARARNHIHVLEENMALGMADVNCRSGTGRVVEYRTGSMGRTKRWSDSGNPQ